MGLRAYKLLERPKEESDVETHRFGLKLKISRVTAPTAQGEESEVLQDTWTDADLLASKKAVTRCKMYRSMPGPWRNSSVRGVEPRIQSRERWSSRRQSQYFG